MRDGNARERGSRDSRRDAGHDFVRDAGRLERERFFAAAAEHERIAALQAHDALGRDAPRGSSGAWMRFLRDRVPAGAFADIEAMRASRNREHSSGDKRVVEHQVGAAEPNDRAPRQERRIAWTGTDERNKS